MRYVLLFLILLTLTACAAPPPRLDPLVEYRCRLFDSTVKPTCTPADLVAEILRSQGRQGYVGPGNYPGYVDTTPYRPAYDLMMAPFPTVIRRAP